MIAVKPIYIKSIIKYLTIVYYAQYSVDEVKS